MPENQQQPANRRLRVLFVDDEPFAVEFFKEELERDNMEVVFCKSAQKAYDAFQSDSYDIVILDVMMPPGLYKDKTYDGMETGLHLLRDFRAIHSMTPVMVLTNISSEKTLAAIQAEAFVKVLDKVKMLPSKFPAEVRAFTEGLPH